MRLQLYIAVVFILFLYSCSAKEEDETNIKVYSGPVLVAENIQTFYSDSGKLKVKLSAPLQSEFLDGDREFAKGIQVDFYDPNGFNSSRLTSRYARYDKTSDIYLATGDVVVQDFKDGKKLNTEKLYWNRNTKRVYTDVFVRIQTKEDVLTGTGLTAAQDFSSYRITSPTGKFKAKADVL